MRKKEQMYSTEKVLIVDHTPNSRNTIKKILTSIGYNIKNIYMVNNASSAVKSVEDMSFDLILCEYNLGYGKNGQQLLEYLKYNKTKDKDTDFLIISSECSEAIVLSAVDEGPEGYIAKPFSAKELDTKIEKIKEGKKLFKKIDILMERNGVEDALLECENLILENPQYMSRILKFKSEILLNNNRLEEAYLLYRALIQSHPKSNMVNLQYSKILIKLEKYDLAKKILKEVVIKNKRILEAYDLLENISIKQKNNKERQLILENVLKVSPLSLKRQKRLAEVAELNGDLKTAYNAYTAIIKNQKHSVLNDNKLKLKWINLQVQKSLQEDNKDNIDISFENLKNYKGVFKDQINSSDLEEIMMLDLSLLMSNKNNKLREFASFHNEYENLLQHNSHATLKVLSKIRESENNIFCDFLISKMDQSLIISKQCQSILSSYKGNKRAVL